MSTAAEIVATLEADAATSAADGAVRQLTGPGGMTVTYRAGEDLTHLLEYWRKRALAEQAATGNYKPFRQHRIRPARLHGGPVQ